MSEVTFVAVMVPYALLGVFAWRLEYHRGANAARNYVILTPISALAFMGIARMIWGFLPTFFVGLLVLVTIANASFARFCSQCGALYWRGSWFSDRRCSQCGGTTFVPLWTALKMRRAGGPAA